MRRIPLLRRVEEEMRFAEDTFFDTLETVFYNFKTYVNKKIVNP